MDSVLERIADQVGLTYPDGAIPIHGRLNHLRHVRFDAAHVVAQEVGRNLVDFVVVSVLLDAGAGAAWTFNDPAAGALARSEGLAFGSFRAMEAGLLSGDGTPFGIDAQGLVGLDNSRLATAMQHGPGNEMAGFEGRVELVHRLGSIITNSGHGSLTEMLVTDGPLETTNGATTVDAGALLEWVLWNLSDLWPGRIELDGHNLGDTWRHSLFDEGEAPGLVPFHKLSQWLTYSLVEPLTHALGVTVVNIEKLTGLAEYRNGGLFLELGAISLRTTAPALPLPPSDELIVEWRALTVALLDVVAERIAAFLPADRGLLGLGEILEAGTWPLGRSLAFDRSPSGEPPIRIQSDGTVF